MNSCLIIFAKNPVPGKVKTRLTPYITPHEASELYKAFIVDITTNSLKLRSDRTTVAYTPSNAETVFLELCGQSVTLLPQKGRNLGERMKNAFRHSFDEGAKRTVIIGTDSPTLPLSYIRKAFDALNNVPIAIGPTFDGGYYLIGLSERSDSIFDDIEWSTSSVFSNTLDRIKAVNKQIYVLPPWYDVDTSGSLEFLRSHILAMKLSGSLDTPGKTTQFLGI